MCCNLLLFAPAVGIVSEGDSQNMPHHKAGHLKQE